MSKKIEQAMIAAIKAGKEWKRANTYVLSGSNTYVRLHGNVIARRIDGGPWEFNLCGWNTPTTRSRINAIAREFGRQPVQQYRGEPTVTVQDPDEKNYRRIVRIALPTEGWF